MYTDWRGKCEPDHLIGAEGKGETSGREIEKEDERERVI